jgi:hypothetical protein
MSEFTDQLERELRAATARRVRLEAARIPRPRGGTAAVLVSLAVCAAVLLVATQIHRTSANPHAPDVSSPPSTQSVDARIAASFHVFRRPRAAADALPPHIRSFGPCGGEGPGNYAWCDVDTSQVVARPQGSSGTLGQPTDTPSRSRLTIYGQKHDLQLTESRRIPLPDQLGSLWLIPSGRWLCAVLDGPRWQTYPVRMRCGTLKLIRQRPPIDFPGYFFGPTAHGIMIAAEPDEIANAVITYPGGTETGLLHDGALVACIGQGPYKLAQRTARGVHLRPIQVGAYGSFKPTSCPELHFSNH